MTTWSLGNPHTDSRSSQQPDQTAPQHWVSFLPLSPFQHTKKAPRLHRPPWYCLYPHNSSKNTEKIPLALCKHKTFLLLKGNSLPQIHTSLHPRNFSSTIWFQFRTAAPICCKPITLFPQKSTAVIYTNLKQVYFLQYVYIAHWIQKVFLSIKNPPKDVFSALIQLKSRTSSSSFCVYWSHRKFLGWSLDKVFNSLWTVSELLVVVWFSRTCPFLLSNKMDLNQNIPREKLQPLRT